MLPAARGMCRAPSSESDFRATHTKRIVKGRMIRTASLAKPVKTGYTFVGWKENLSDAAFVSTDADFLSRFRCSI